MGLQHDAIGGQLLYIEGGADAGKLAHECCCEEEWDPGTDCKCGTNDVCYHVELPANVIAAFCQSSVCGGGNPCFGWAGPTSGCCPRLVADLNPEFGPPFCTFRHYHTCNYLGGYPVTIPDITLTFGTAPDPVTLTVCCLTVDDYLVIKCITGSISREKFICDQTNLILLTCGDESGFAEVTRFRCA